MVERRRDPYHAFSISKRSPERGKRTISAPSAEMMSVQKWLLKRVLNPAIGHPNSFAYEPGRSIRQCAARHCGARWIVSLDLHDFFHSVDEKRVFQVFETLGYNRLVSFELSRICTRLIGRNIKPSNVRPETYSISAYVSENLGFLPQGAPTSGKLANLVAADLDERLLSLATEYRLVYTRYADDLFFSSSGDFDRAVAVRLIREIGDLVAVSGFEIHRKKTRVLTPGSRKQILGLLVDDLAGPRLTRRTRAQIEAHLRGVETFGVVAHREHRRFDSTWGFVAHVWGLLAFAASIEPDWARPARFRWENALSRDGWGSDVFRPDLYFVNSHLAERES
ncbi:reverse transcriptase family protein [Pseudonocardia sp. N23]|uniref:reverse transcriptase family protein n=1 Tax=Pseudonocardia sp. N23 TaxID=1987376 RepID=UPI002110FEA0|nr:reverse transcriptase family protein [Pseudonocardia sp. N23]